MKRKRGRPPGVECMANLEMAILKAGNQVKLARALKVSRARVWAWVHRISRPSPLAFKGLLNYLSKD